MARSLTYRFRLTDEEFRRAWLAEYYRRPGWRSIRILGGPMFVGLGVLMLRGEDTFGRVMGVLAILLGVWYAVKPWLGARVMTKQRRESGRADVELAVTFGARGVKIDDGKVQTELSWEDITGAGLGRGYVWYEIRGGSRATVPLRVVDDLDALRETLREHTRWAG